MRSLKVLLGAVLLLSLAGTTSAGEAQSLQQENTQLRRRLERLEKELEDVKKAPATQGKSAGTASSNKDIESLRQENTELKQRLEKLEKASAASGTKATSQRAAAPAEAKSSKPQPSATPAKDTTPSASSKPAPAPAPAPPVPPQKKNVLSSLDIELYGIIKGDASYDDSRTYPGNYVVYLDSEATRHNDNEFNLTANQTRLGMRINGPATETFKTSGLVEFDFYGNYAAENKAKIQMRLGYVVLDWPTSQFSVLAGQAADIISPLVPNTLNYTVLWDAGNIGYRRPQVRLTQGISFGENVAVKLDIGAARTIGRTDLTSSETGEDAGVPTGQARVGVTFPFLGPKPTTIGVSGHIGKEEYDIDAAGRNVDLDSQSINVDLTQPVFPWLVILAECFDGQNLNEYFGGIGQGVNTATLKEIGAHGGWVAANLGPWSQWSFSVGGGVDGVDRADVATGARTRNSYVFFNVLYAFNKNAQIGFEVSRWDTNYKGPGDADDTRAQASFIYKF